jgi:hypothetical protein
MAKRYGTNEKRGHKRPQLPRHMAGERGLINEAGPKKEPPKADPRNRTGLGTGLVEPARGNCWEGY